MEKLTEVSRNPKYLKVRVKSNDGDKVNINFPLSLAKLLLSFNKNGFSKRVGVDVGDDQIDQIISAVSNGESDEIVNIESNDGDSVMIYVE